MKLNIEFINMLYDIKWFSNCGKQVPVELGKSVNKKQAMKNIASLTWENRILESRGNLTVKLSNRSCSGNGNEYQEWNNLVNDYKKNYYSKLETL